MMQSSPFNLPRAVVLIGRLIVGAIFVYAGYAKVTTPNLMLSSWVMFKFSVSTNLNNFAAQIVPFKIVGQSGASFIAHTLPFAEIILGLCLIFGLLVRYAGAAISLMLLGFLAVLTRAYILHMDVNCTCFGTPEPLTILTLARDSAFAAIAVITTVLAFREAKRPHPWTAQQPAS
jgi:uncharacterized membrane protein YphA (DoxX/SURF4 family)